MIFVNMRNLGQFKDVILKFHLKPRQRVRVWIEEFEVERDLSINQNVNYHSFVNLHVESSIVNMMRYAECFISTLEVLVNYSIHRHGIMIRQFKNMMCKNFLF